MKKKLLHLALSGLILSIGLLSLATTAFADTPEEHSNDAYYTTKEERASLPDIYVDYSNGLTESNRIIEDEQIIQPRATIIATFKALNGTGYIYSTSYVGYNYTTSGKTVLTLQGALKALGYNPGTLDGIFGPNTHSALIKYQQNNGLSVDAVCGPNTWKKLGSQCAGKTLPIRY